VLPRLDTSAGAGKLKGVRRCNPTILRTAKKWEDRRVLKTIDASMHCYSKSAAPELRGNAISAIAATQSRFFIGVMLEKAVHLS